MTTPKKSSNQSFRGSRRSLTLSSGDSFYSPPNSGCSGLLPVGEEELITAEALPAHFTEDQLDALTEEISKLQVQQWKSRSDIVTTCGVYFSFQFLLWGILTK